MMRDRIEAKEISKHTDLIKEEIKMTSRKWGCKWSLAFKALAVGLVTLAILGAVPAITVLADGSHNMCQGQPGPNGGTQCSTGSLIIGISAVVVNATDCTTRAAILPEKLTFDLVFREGANAPYSAHDLKAIIVNAIGYVPVTITSFVQMQLNLFFFVLNIIFAGNQCLMPGGGPGPVPVGAYEDCDWKLQYSNDGGLTWLDFTDPLNPPRGQLNKFFKFRVIAVIATGKNKGSLCTADYTWQVTWPAPPPGTPRTTPAGAPTGNETGKPVDVQVPGTLTPGGTAKLEIWTKDKNNDTQLAVDGTFTIIK
ncbi:hypothetical protein HYR54_05055 [Candidatus Acetothermia bacterium]|nr:hypothetical protein [Candidatus Acetothermia bacterium]